uniref:Putative secreted protein n=1 Tax=Ixodes ricinus TaxID=34613 RepID=A0A6B0TY24_IXORI
MLSQLRICCIIFYIPFMLCSTFVQTPRGLAHILKTTRQRNLIHHAYATRHRLFPMRLLTTPLNRFKRCQSI